MPYQKYSDISLVFGPPSGERYEMLSGIANKVRKPFSEIYLEFLSDVLKKKNGESLIEETLSIVTEEEIWVGDICFTYQCWFEEREEFAKFIQGHQSGEADSTFPIKIPVLMLYPDSFVTKFGTKIETIVQSEHVEYLAAMISQTLELDWVQTLCALREKIPYIMGET